MPKKKIEISDKTNIICRHCGEPLGDLIGGTTHFCEKKPKKERKK